MDLGGVALAAIKGLLVITKEQGQRITDIETTALTPGPSPDFAGEGNTGDKLSVASGQLPVGDPAAPQVTVIRQAVPVSNAALWGIAGALALFAVAVLAHGKMSRSHARQ